MRDEHPDQGGALRTLHGGAEGHVGRRGAPVVEPGAALANGAPQVKFTEAISLIVTCEAQEEIDELWTKRTADGGSEGQRGWLKDRFGVSWQIVPSALPRLLGPPEPARAARVMQEMMQMKKLDIARLEDAAR
ncbi:VOC family protein [Sorangium sp. So ce1036]|uniref:VOC family protein n=1 Tax=Sorangium sp. So ce1036 TaxID=3133328 RepID=UPI003F04158E